MASTCYCTQQSKSCYAHAAYQWRIHKRLFVSLLELFGLLPVALPSTYISINSSNLPSLHFVSYSSTFTALFPHTIHLTNTTTCPHPTDSSDQFEFHGKLHICCKHNWGRSWNEHTFARLPSNEGKNMF